MADKPYTNLKNTDLLTVTGLHKHYRTGGQDLHVMRGVDMTVKQGEWLAILGASGSGKSTLLHLVGGLDRPDGGTVLFKGQDVYDSGVLDRNVYRCNTVGFVFQFYHLLPEFTALENVLAAALVRHGVFSWLGQKRQAKARAQSLLEQVGLKDRTTHKPSKLSGGERQRVAIARALMNEPTLLLADEPTGNLDAETGAQLLKLFTDLHKAGQTIVMVTHDLRVADTADRVVRLERGKVDQAGVRT
ncbi:MAG: ATP-binding cassette domain-containing protein [Phycisphaera sp.]|nr:ATP-binding cassette domain-containing protein [Phycisphaera sp.]